jgi:hypothetical protein
MSRLRPTWQVRETKNRDAADRAKRRGISFYSTAVFTLNPLSGILSVVVLSCSFGAQKNEKARHT